MNPVYPLDDRKNNLEEAMLFGKREAIGNKLDRRPILCQNDASSDKETEQESSSGNFEVLKNTTPAGGSIEPRAVEDEGFKVMRNVSPPGGPAEMTEEEKEQLKVI